MTLPASFHEEHAATMARIDARVKGWQAEEREKTAALVWCRANGNPHLQSKAGD